MREVPRLPLKFKHDDTFHKRNGSIIASGFEKAIFKVRRIPIKARGDDRKIVLLHSSFSGVRAAIYKSLDRPGMGLRIFRRRPDGNLATLSRVMRTEEPTPCVTTGQSACSPVVLCVSDSRLYLLVGVP